MRGLLLASTLLVVAGCGGSKAAAPTQPPPEPLTTQGETTTQDETTAAEDTPKPPPGLPAFVAGYTKWSTLAKRLPPRDSDPHLGTKTVYASKHAGPNGVFPDRTIVVKEAFRPGKDFIGLIATMRKKRGADPAHNDWIFVEWARDSENEPFSELASGAVCYGCHVGAAESDYVWTAR